MSQVLSRTQWQDEKIGELSGEAEESERIINHWLKTELHMHFNNTA